MPVKNWKGALLSGKCPRCRKGDIFKHPLSDVLHFAKMNETCPHCGTTFEPEPGFYFGAMFVSYALSVALFVVVGLGLYFLFNPSDWVYITTIGIAAVLFTPISFRYSRILFLYAFGGIGYDPNVG